MLTKFVPKIFLLLLNHRFSRRVGGIRGVELLPPGNRYPPILKFLIYLLKKIKIKSSPKTTRVKVWRKFFTLRHTCHVNRSLLLPFISPLALTTKNDTLPSVDSWTIFLIQKNSMNFLYGFKQNVKTSKKKRNYFREDYHAYIKSGICKGSEYQEIALCIKSILSA